MYTEVLPHRTGAFRRRIDENGFLTSNAFSGRDDMQSAYLATTTGFFLFPGLIIWEKELPGGDQNMNLVLGLKNRTDV